MGLGGNILQPQGAGVVLHNVIVHGGNAQAFRVGKGVGMAAGAEGYEAGIVVQGVQQADKLRQLGGPGGVLQAGYFFGRVAKRPGRHFVSVLPLGHKGFKGFHFGQAEQGLQPAVGVEKDGDGFYFEAVFRAEVSCVAFKQVGQVGAQQVNFAGAERVHAVARQQGAFAFLYPGNLYLGMAVQVGVKVRQRFFLHDKGMVVRDGNGEGQHFHWGNMGVLRGIGKRRTRLELHKRDSRHRASAFFVILNAVKDLLKRQVTCQAWRTEYFTDQHRGEDPSQAQDDQEYRGE